MATSKKILFLTQFSLLAALEVIVCFTPLGTIPMGPMAATLSAVPVIVTAILLGPKAGTAMGFLFGLCSFLYWVIFPGPMAFVFNPAVSGSFWSLVICFVPRTLTGTVAGVLFQALDKRIQGKANSLAYGISGLVASLVNTFGVLGGIYFLLGQQYAAYNGLEYGLLLGIIGTTVLTNGVPEAIVSFVVGAAVCLPVRRILAKQR